MKNTGNKRRNVIKAGLASLAAFVGLSRPDANAASGTGTAGKQVVGEIYMQDDVPLFSGAVKHGNLLFIAGKGAHFDGDISAHTDHVLNEIQKELERNGSSMDKVLKVNVYLADLHDYQAMNKVYRGRFGKNPPVRTTVATYGGVPGDSLVEIDCIAALD
jgi:2-iminobutanoate/2-iminopropanoate deaminase